MTSNGTMPGYIPAHLRGKVDSFRQEADGRISFRHDAAGNGGFGEAAARKFITPQQYKQTFDEEHRMANMADSMEGQYGIDRYPTNFSQQANEWIGKTLGRGLDWGTSSQGKATGTAGLLAALAGGIGGTLMSRRAGSEHPYRNGLLAALLSGTAGAGIAALSSDRVNRRAEFAKTAAISDETAYLRSVIMGDSKMGPTEKAEILRALSKMQDDERDKLANTAQKLFGFGAGMYIARVLFSKGLIPSLVGGMLGVAAVSSSKNHSPKMNPWGQLST